MGSFTVASTGSFKGMVTGSLTRPLMETLNGNFGRKLNGNLDWKFNTNIDGKGGIWRRPGNGKWEKGVRKNRNGEKGFKIGIIILLFTHAMLATPASRH